MALSKQPSQQPMADLLYRKLHRVFFALCILLAPLALSLWFGLCPTGARDAACPDQGSSLAVLAAFRAMNPQLMQTFLFLNLIIPFLYPLSYIGLGMLAMKRSPWLATLGMACGFAAGIVWGVIADQIAVLYGMAQIGINPLFVRVENHVFANWMTLAFGAFWVIGHQLGYVLLGIALVRARAIPLWAAILIIVSVLVMGPIAYGTNHGLLQVLGYGLVFIGSLPAAFAMVKARDEQVVAPLGPISRKLSESAK
jgi:hypothetical protein